MTNGDIKHHDDKNILEIANSLVNGKRDKEYGPPHKNFQDIADIVSVLLRTRYGVDVRITADFAAILMCAVKLTREAHLPKEDNRIDLAGYALVLDKCAKEQAANGE